MGKYLLGLDSGNTICKATIFDTEGNVVATSSARIPSYHPAQGHHERNLTELWEYAAKTIRNVIAKADIWPGEIAAVGICGHGNGLYLLDKQKKVLRGIQSVDTRAAGICAEWEAAGLADKVYPYTRQKLWPAQTNSLLAWLKKEEPVTYEKIGTVFLSKDYLNFCLTGEIASDYSDMSATNLLDIERKNYNPALLDMYGLGDLLPDLPMLKKSYEVIGKVTANAAIETGLMPGTKVVAGMIDVCANLIGSGICSPGQIGVIAGTWSVNATLTDKPLVNNDLAMSALFASPQYHISIEADASSMTNLEWFVDQFCPTEKRRAKKAGISVFQICDQMVAAQVPRQDAPFYLPYLYGGNIHKNAKGGFFGLSGWHTKADMLWSLYEGIVFGHKYHIEKLQNAGIQNRSVRLTGGASGSGIFGQLFADVLGMEVEICSCRETGTWGAAFSTGIGAGLYSSFQELTPDIKVVFEPNLQNQALYQLRYELYKVLATTIPEAIKKGWHKSF
ncbi:FGGY-family carbohydrate kinase [Dyadobacter sp. CY323]|uniref:FGGY-family carbohydrate kinase n=1 Tax=Dyadobacter sp. CY323 TaxID=2907302 RepID=UPI001F1B651F|nr:FGGY-family carbohydrate kinase [Dyadobacter sp. CY323]MCE6991827.1 carbohydrate kinase [Dyadobacter sp. CY323]